MTCSKPPSEEVGELGYGPSTFNDYTILFQVFVSAQSLVSSILGLKHEFCMVGDKEITRLYSLPRPVEGGGCLSRGSKSASCGQALKGGDVGS